MTEIIGDSIVSSGANIEQECRNPIEEPEVVKPVPVTKFITSPVHASTAIDVIGRICVQKEYKITPEAAAAVKNIAQNGELFHDTNQLTVLEITLAADKTVTSVSIESELKGYRCLRIGEYKEDRITGSGYQLWIELGRLMQDQGIAAISDRATQIVRVIVESKVQCTLTFERKDAYYSDTVIIS